MTLRENKVHHMDNLEGMKLIPSKSVNLIISDPPYFEVKGNFDFVFKNFLVVVPFAGSGTECAMAAKEGRRFIGFDVEKKYVEMSNKRADVHLRQPALF